MLYKFLASIIVAFALVVRFVLLGPVKTVSAHFARQSISNTYKFEMTGVPLSVNGTTQQGHAIDSLNYDYIDFFVMIGANATSVDAKIQESTAADGNTTPTDVSGAAIVQITVANKMAIISVKKSTLTKRYAFVLITTVGTAVVASWAVGYGQVDNLPVTQSAAVTNHYATVAPVAV